jgi:hypothetical protein
MGDTEATAMHETPIIIVGGGPVGMLTALNLSRFGVKCLLAEQSLETTKWPKMDLTNCRTMEIFRMMGIADEYRALEGAVGGNFKMNSLFYHSVSPGSELITSWVCVLDSIWTRDFTDLVSSNFRLSMNGVNQSSSITMVLNQRNQARGARKLY